MSVDDPLVVAGRKSTGGERAFRIVDRGIVEWNEAVEAAVPEGASDVIEPFWRPQVSRTLFRPERLATQRNGRRKPGTVDALGAQTAVVLVHFKADDAIADQRLRLGGLRNRRCRCRYRFRTGRGRRGRPLGAGNRRGQEECSDAISKCVTPAAWLVGALGLFAAAGIAVAERDDAAALNSVVGSEQRVLATEGQTLLEIAAQHRVGFEPLTRLNPEIDPWIPDPGSIVRLPTRLILPMVDLAYHGLVINLPEMRLYDFTVDPPEIFAVAIGDAMDPSLIGDFQIGAKRVDPAWHVPKSILEEKPQLPPVVPPGPDNPLGSRWMTIGSTSYGIHGTNRRWSIGRDVTHGCIRLYEADIQRLYERTPTGTPLKLIYQPFKWGVEGGRVFLEVHPDLYRRFPDRLATALSTPRALGLLDRVDVEQVWRVLEMERGVPVAVGTLAAPGPPEPATSKPTS